MSAVDELKENRSKIRSEIMNPVCKMLGTKYPIIQGAMANISNPELVAAVSEAGGYGLLASGSFSGIKELEQQMEAVRKLTEKPFGVNLMARNPQSKEYVDIIADFGIPAVTTSAGSPAELAPLLKKKGIKMIHVVPNAAFAVKAEAAGADAVVAEGMESGGLQGSLGVTTMVLVPAVVDAVKIPVLAAGGIADKRGYRAAFALGAQGVQIGTAFMVSKECVVSSVFKELILQAAETDTSLVGRGRVYSRVIRTPYVAGILGQSEYDGDLHDIAKEGETSNTMVSAGQCVGLLRKIKTVKEIIEEMVA
jgi:enoyl-[acyl-carrier protein] reductase II